MNPLTKKEQAWSVAIGLAIGCVAGVMISLAMFKEHKKCEALKREHQMMQEMLIYYQNQSK